MSAGDWHHLGVNFGPPGVELWIDGVLQTGTGEVINIEPPRGPTANPCTGMSSDGIAGNDIPWFFGVNNGFSSPGTTDDLRSYFRGGSFDHIRISRARRDFSAYAP